MRRNREAVESLEYKGYRIDILPDFDPVDPREDYDHLGKMYCWHSRYNLGDWKDNDYEAPSQLEIALAQSKSNDVVLSLYLYDHSGITMRTGPFSDPWDSGQVGYIVAWATDIRKEYGVKRISKQIRAKVKALLEAEVEEYNQYLTGQVYGYIISAPKPELVAVDSGEYDADSDEEMDLDDDERWEESDSCWGFYGLEYCIEEAKGIVDYKAA